MLMISSLGLSISHLVSLIVAVTIFKPVESVCQHL